MTVATISEELLDAYNYTYSDIGEGWRKVGAIPKAKHVVELCEKNKIKPKKILEYGAGTGDILKCLADWDFAEEFHAVEISSGSCDHIRNSGIKNLKSVSPFDGYKTDFEDNSFDLVILSHVLEHVEFERLVLRELQRISTYQVIEVPLDYTLSIDTQADHFMSYGHINAYRPNLLRFLLKTESYQIIDDTCNMTEHMVRVRTPVQ